MLYQRLLIPTRTEVFAFGIKMSAIPKADIFSFYKFQTPVPQIAAAAEATAAAPPPTATVCGLGCRWGSRVRMPLGFRLGGGMVSYPPPETLSPLVGCQVPMCRWGSGQFRMGIFNPESCPGVPSDQSCQVTPSHGDGVGKVGRVSGCWIVTK